MKRTKKRARLDSGWLNRARRTKMKNSPRQGTPDWSREKGQTVQTESQMRREKQVRTKRTLHSTKQPTKGREQTGGGAHRATADRAERGRLVQTRGDGLRQEKDGRLAKFLYHAYGSCHSLSTFFALLLSAVCRIKDLEITSTLRAKVHLKTKIKVAIKRGIC